MSALEMRCVASLIQTNNGIDQEILARCCSSLSHPQFSSAHNLHHHLLSCLTLLVAEPVIVKEIVQAWDTVGAAAQLISHQMSAFPLFGRDGGNQSRSY